MTSSPGLIVREHDGRSLTLVAQHFTRPLVTLGAPIADATACSTAAYVAAVSEAGELVVYSLDRQEVVLHRLPEGL